MHRQPFAILGIILGITVIHAPAKAQFHQAWFSQGNGVGTDDTGDRLAIDVAGNVVVAGRADTRSQNTKLLLTKRDPAGNVLWTRLVDPTPPAIIDNAPFLGVDGTGAILVVWQEDIFQGGVQIDAPVHLAKIDPNGVDVWRVTYDPTDFVSLNDAAVTPDGGLVLAGSVSTANGEEFLAVKVKATGAVQWEDRFAPSHDTALALAVTVNGVTGDIAVGGDTTTAPPPHQLPSVFTESSLIVRYDPDGKRRWWKKIASSPDKDERVLDLAIDPSGDVIAAGLRRGRSTGLTDGFVDKLSSQQGRLVWTGLTNASLPGASLGFVGTDASGNVVAAGSADTATGTDRLLVRFSAAGVATSVEQFDTRTDDVITAMVVRADGNAYVTGYASDFNLANPTVWLTSRFDPVAGHAWDATLDVATYYDWDKGFGIGVAPNGAIVVTGRTLNVVAPSTFSGDETTIEYLEP